MCGCLLYFHSARFICTLDNWLAQVAIAVMIVASVLPLLCQASAVLLLQPERTGRAAFDGCLSTVKCMDGVTAIASTSFIQVYSSLDKHNLHIVMATVIMVVPQRVVCP